MDDKKVLEVFKELEIRIIKLELNYKSEFGTDTQPDFDKLRSTTKLLE
jgi:hypothetical protein